MRPVDDIVCVGMETPGVTRELRWLTDEVPAAESSMLSELCDEGFYKFEDSFDRLFMRRRELLSPERD